MNKTINSNLYLINSSVLGNRLIGYRLYSQKQGVIGISEKELIRKINSGEKINGIVLEGDRLTLDKKGFNCVNIMQESGINTLTPCNSCEVETTVFYTVMSYEPKTKTFKIINSRYLVVDIDEATLKGLMKFSLVAGVRLDENGNVKICETEKSDIEKADV